MRGRPTKSTSDLAASGTLKKSRVRDRLENNVKKVGWIPPPAHLNKWQRNKWAEVVGHVAEFGILAEQDYDAVLRYVELSYLCEIAFRDIQTEGVSIDDGKGGIKKNPAIAVYQESEKMLFRLREKFGFTPRDRQAVKTKEKETKADPFLSVLSPQKAKVG